MEDQPHTDDRFTGIARFVSTLFTPFIIPTGAFLALFLFSYFRIMPMAYKTIVVGIVFCFTIAMPLLTIYLFCKIHGVGVRELRERKKRYMPYLLTIISYAFCLIMMYRLNIPRVLVNIIIASLLIMVIFLIINLKWKLSEHMGGAGAVIGGLVSFSTIFGYNPVWWLCVFILITGVLGSARIVLGQHTLSEVIGGFTIGLVCSLLVLHPISNLFFRFYFP